jgi:DNA-directed RNA polymerase subunit RPC12/RpoP
MAWCPHCERDRPIRGPYGEIGDGELGGLCAYCATRVFAKARSESEYERFAKKKKEECFVVTATVGNANDPIVCNMRQFRNEILIRKRLGRVFINWYYKYGPLMAERIKESFFLKKLCYILILIPIHLIVKFMFGFSAEKRRGVF